MSAGGEPPASIVPTAPDDFTSKLIKYIPAETIALATLFFGAWTIAGDWVWFWVAVGAILNMGYLYGMTFASPRTTNPAWYFYVLSAAAFVAWAVATVDVVEKAASVDNSAKAGVILAFAALAIPTVDQILSAGKDDPPAAVPATDGHASTVIPVGDPPAAPKAGKKALKAGKGGASKMPAGSSGPT